MRNLNFSRRTASRYDFKKLIRLKPSTCMVIQEPNGNTWIWPTKASKTIQQITANLIGTATIATTPLKSFAQWYGLKSKESLRLWPLTAVYLGIHNIIHPKKTKTLGPTEEGLRVSLHILTHVSMSQNDPKCSFATVFILWWEGQANLVSTMRPSAFAKIVSRGKNNMKISISTGLRLWCCHCFAFYRFKSATPTKCHVNVM